MVRYPAWSALVRFFTGVRRLEFGGAIVASFGIVVTILQLTGLA